MTAEFEFIQTKFDQPSIIYSGFQYRRKRLNKNGSSTWTCVKEKSGKCKGVLVVQGEEILRSVNHSCVGDVAAMEAVKVMATCRKRVREEVSVPVCKIFKEETGKFSDKGLELVAAISTYENVKCGLNARRRQTLGVKQQPSHSSELVIPEELLQFTDGYSFLQFDDVEDGNRILVFAHDTMKTAVESASTLFVDGTFSSCSTLFYQLYSVHADVGSSHQCTNILPAIFALLPNKTEKTYNRLFRFIKIYCPAMNPKHIVLDFETAVFNSLYTLLPTTKLRGCHFHFTQALWRKVQSIGLAERYKNEEVIRFHIRRCAALAHLPLNKVEEGFLLIMEDSPEDEKITEFNNYFVEQWMENKSIPLEAWNCFEERHRTNNAVEGWHNKLNRSIEKKHPNIYILLRVLKQEALESCKSMRLADLGMLQKKGKRFIWISIVE